MKNIKHRVLLGSIIALAVLCVLCMSYFFISRICNIFSDKVVTSIGKTVYEEFYTEGGFQDFTDFGIYQFKDADLTNNEYLNILSVEEKAELLSYIDNFEGWISSVKSNTPDAEIAVNYSFDRECITDGDYAYIYDKCEHEELYREHKYADYDVYFFDTETQILYYFHNNI